MKRVTLDYTIYLTDRVVVAERQAAVSSYRARGHLGGSYPPDQFVNYPDAGTGVMFMSPQYAAIKYTPATVVIDGGTPAVGVPYITSPWIKSLTQTNLPIYEDVFEKKVGGWFGLSWLFGTTVRFEWAAHFAYIAPAVPTVDGVPVTAPPNIQRRRWIDGFELPVNGEGGSGASQEIFSRAASRSAEGAGFAFVNSNVRKAHTPIESLGGASPSSSWERMYVKLVAKPTSATYFWFANGAAAASAGVILGIQPTGQISIYNHTLFNGQLLMGSTAAPLVIGTWYRLDILVKFGGHVDGASLRLVINGTDALTIAFGATEGLGLAGNVHSTSAVGDALSLSQAAKLLGLYIDDWMCADYPPVTTIPGNDWLNGSRMVLIQPQSAALSNAWAGDYRYLLQHGNDVSSIGPGMTSSTASARLAMIADVEQVINAYPGALGPVAMIVGKYGVKGAGADGTLGYSVNSLAAVMAAIVENTAAQWNSVLFNMIPAVTPSPISPIELYHDKGATATAATVYTLAAVVEIIGQFGPEDVRTEATTVAPVLGNTGLHNSAYPRTPWARLGQSPLSAVQIKSGTYVGTGNAIDLFFDMPLAWIFIRNVTDATLGGYWTTSLATAHRNQAIGSSAYILPQAKMDPNFVADGIEDNQQTRCVLSLTGAATSANTVGKTYQYIAFMDPGMRFMLNGALRVHRGTLDAVTPLVKPAYLAECAFFFRETMAGGVTTELWFKGRGHEASTASKLDAAETAAVVAFAAGAITSKSAFANAGNQTAFTLLRRDDGSGDVGLPRVLCHYSYVGDGAASRTLPIAPATGDRRPLFAIIVPHNGASFFRDPSHTGTTSSTFGAGSFGANAATGITAGGVDQVTIGLACNANGITYELFVLPGCTANLNNGWSDQCTSRPVVPIQPPDGPWPPIPPDPPLPPAPPPIDPVDPPPGDPPGPTDPPGEEFGTQCVARSQKLINRALGMLGISQPIVDVVLEQTVEATLARLNYDDCVLAVLRDFPWPFATRYAELTLAHGTEAVPANADWTYAYRAPYDMVYARRLVRDGTKRAYDPDPIKFRTGTGGINVLDTLGVEIEGYLIFTNEVLDVVTLEYTNRHLCAAGTGDALFREALMWKVAHTLAPALARDEKKIDRAAGMYERCLNVAKARSASEQQPDTDEGDAPWITGR